MVVITSGGKRDWNPEFRLIGPVEFRTHDADNPIRSLIQNNGTANDVRVRAKPLVPGLIRQNDNQAGARLILLWSKDSTERGLYLEYVEIARRNPGTLHQFRVGVLATEIEAAAVHDGNVRKDVLAFGGIGKIGRRQRDIA